MRILDSETHPVLPAGVAARYKLRDGRLEAEPGTERVAAASAAARTYEDFTADLIAQMDAHGIERSVIMRTNVPALNEDIARIVQQHPDRLVGFASWDAEPTTGSPPRESARALEALDRGLRMEGLVGVGEVSLQRRFAPALTPEQACEAFAPTLELCRRHRRPIMFHTGSGDPSPNPYQDPMKLEPLAAAFPDVPLLIAHSGGADETCFSNALRLARRHPNVYLTTSISTPAFVERAVAAVGAERIIFGTDWSPIRRVRFRNTRRDCHAVALDVVRNAAIADRDREFIFGENLAALLGI